MQANKSRSALLFFLPLLLAACAVAPPMPPAATLFHDELFAAPTEPVDPADALALSPAMQQQIAERGMARPAAGADRRKRLLDALTHGDLRLDYDPSRTRTAAGTFAARSGNCLALVLMTAAFAKELGLGVHYQVLVADRNWDRSDELYIAVGHINLRLEVRPTGAGTSLGGAVVVDFLPPDDAARLPTRELEEGRVVAMYLNNRAVESLKAGRIDDAYWWARAAVRLDPGWAAGYLTLGVVYRVRQRPDLAEEALLRVALQEPDNLAAMANRVPVLRALGRKVDADALAQRLAALEPHPPFGYFNDGLTALRDGHPELARRLFTREVARSPDHPEFEYWLAVACLTLGDGSGAQQHLARAVEASTTHSDHDLYTAKLDRLKALQHRTRE